MDVKERVAERRALDALVLVPLAASIVRGAVLGLVGGQGHRTRLRLRVWVDGGGRRRWRQRHLDVGDARVAILGHGPPPAALLPIQLGLDAQILHLVHLAHRLAQVLGKLAPVMLVARVEHHQHPAVQPLAQTDPKWII